MSRFFPEIVIPKNQDMENDDDEKDDEEKFDDDKIVGSMNDKDSTMTCNHVMWSHECDPEDFGHALDFLMLCMDKDDAKDYVKDLMDDANDGKLEHYKVVDIFRAAKAIPADPTTDSNAKQHVTMMKDGKKMSPVMLVRGEKSKSGMHPIIADGYHRLSAAYAIDTEMLIPCLVADK